MTALAVPRVIFEGARGGRLPADRWLSPVTAADESVFARVEAPVLDIGCGPARHVLELAARGFVTLGIDVTPGAVALAHARGAPVLERSVFDRIPGAGRWASALLLDGNIGIGGNSVGLLSRVADLLAPAGRVLVELDAPPQRGGTVDVVRVRVDGYAGPWFAWARVGVHEIAGIAARAGLVVSEEWSDGGRSFAALTVRADE